MTLFFLSGESVEVLFFFFSSRRRHTRSLCDWSSDVCSSDLGYWGSIGGRDINSPGSWGLHKKPQPKPRRFSVSYHLLALREGAGRLRLQVWCEDGEPVPSVVSVWPTADWHEREAW